MRFCVRSSFIRCLNVYIFSHILVNPVSSIAQFLSDKILNLNEFINKVASLSNYVFLNMFSSNINVSKVVFSLTSFIDLTITPSIF